MESQAHLAPLRSIRKNLTAGFAIILIFGGGLGTLSATTEISGAVISAGTLVVDSSVKKVQHPVGGVVAELKVRNGDRIKAGDLLVRLDATMARANLAVLSKSLDELAARQARLESERDGSERLQLSQQLLGRTADPEVASIVQAEQKLFELRRVARIGQKAQMTERMVQLQEEIRGLEAQAKAKSQEMALIERELEGVRELRAKGLVPLARLTTLEREASRLGGERSQLIASVARARAKIAETELQSMQIDQDLRSEVAKELRDIQAKSAELSERKIAAEDQLRRIDIRAPADGVIHQLTIHTIGGVIANGETLMIIVPDADRLVIEAKVSPQEIDQVRIGQSAIVRFSSLNQHTTPEITSSVTVVSADLVIDQRTAQSYYTVRMGLTDHELAKLGDVKLVPGMPVEAYVQTSARTMLSYLTKPLHDQIERAFRER
jgi:HlyD family secretion protein